MKSRKLKFGGLLHPIEKEFRDSHDEAILLPEQKKKTPEKPFTTENQTIVSRTTGLPHTISFGPQPDGLVKKNPFASLAQAGYLHSHPEILGSKALKEWDNASRGRKIPKHVKKGKGK